jgi:hypothetical protein
MQVTKPKCKDLTRLSFIIIIFFDMGVAKNVNINSVSFLTLSHNFLLKEIK